MPKIYNWRATTQFVSSGVGNSFSYSFADGSTKAYIWWTNFTRALTLFGTYVFTYNGTNWLFNGAAVSLLNYGIELSPGATPASGDSITVIYAALTYGVEPPNQSSWQNATVGEQSSNSWGYFYRDSNMAQSGQYRDSISSRVITTVAQGWEASIDSRNNLIITINTVVGPIIRDDIRGSDNNTPKRYINLYSMQNGQIKDHLLGPLEDAQVASAHTIYNNTLSFSETITLAPGIDATSGTLLIHNQTEGGISYDEILIGVQFRNPLPADYRPGTTFKSDEPYYPGDQTGIWLSHNRADKAAHVLADVQNITWQEMRTINGDSGGQGNPPLILHQADANSWYNQKLLGKE